MVRYTRRNNNGGYEWNNVGKSAELPAVKRHMGKLEDRVAELESRITELECEVKAFQGIPFTNTISCNIHSFAKNYCSLEDGMVMNLVTRDDD